jgi:beta-lactamase class A
MRRDRRTLLAALPGLILAPRAQAAAGPPPPALAAYERASGGRVGLYARNLQSGATLAWRADERFVMCSTFKASAAACTLARVDRGQERLDAVVPFGPADLMDYAPAAKAHVGEGGMTVEAMCQAAVELSDNTCANALLHRLGGPAALTAFWRAAGDGVTRLDQDEPMLNRTPLGRPENTTTPRAMAGVLQRLVLGDTLKPASRARLTEWMVNCKTGDKRLRAGLPRTWRIGDKTGNNGKDAAGDIAVAWPAPDRPVLICAYTRGGAPSTQHLETLFAALGRAVGERLA